MNDCWLWTGYIDRDGYGRGKGRKLAHRLAYQVFVGPIPDGLEIDHLCRVRNCVNPDHLEAVTHAENVRRGATAQKTECVNGHSFDEVNTYHHNGVRHCRACNSDRVRRYKIRKFA